MYSLDEIIRMNNPIYYNNCRNNCENEGMRQYCFGKRIALNHIAEKFLGITYFGYDDGILMTRYPSFDTIQDKLK